MMMMMIGNGKYSVKFNKKESKSKSKEEDGELEVTDTLLRFSSTSSNTSLVEIEKKDILCIIPTPKESYSVLKGSGNLSLKQIQKINKDTLTTKEIIKDSFSVVTITRSSSKILKKSRALIKYYTFHSTDSDFKLLLLSSSTTTTTIKRRILFLLNPFSGRGKSLQIFQSIVEPLLKLCGGLVEYELVKTEYPLHAQEIVKSLNKEEYSAIVTVSGDGLFHEVVNGLYQSDLDLATTTTTTTTTTTDLIPLGIIPAGTGNALVKSLLGSCLVELSVLNIVQMETRRMDLFSFQFSSSSSSSSSNNNNNNNNNNNKEIRIGFLEFMWAFVADVDLESEFMRWAGSFRNTVAAVYRLLKFRNYEGTLYYLKNNQNQKENYTWDSFHEEINSSSSSSSSSKKWIKVDGRFCYFMAMNAAWCAEDCLVAPDAAVDDGLLDLVYIQNGTRRKMLKFLLDTESGKYIEEEFVEHHQTAAFVLEPKKYREKYGVLDVDGELAAEYGKVLVQVMPQKCTVIAPPQPKPQPQPQPPLQKK